MSLEVTDKQKNLPSKHWICYNKMYDFYTKKKYFAIEIEGTKKFEITAII